jgi:hypothetical protein
VRLEAVAIQVLLLLLLLLLLMLLLMLDCGGRKKGSPIRGSIG